MILIMCVGLKMFLGRGREKEGLGAIRKVEKAGDFFMGGWLGIGGEQDREGVIIILCVFLEIFI
jgi:hypothetical protein